MRSSTILAFIFMCFVCSIAKTAKDEDFSEFDDFDHDEFVDETPSSTGATPSTPKTQSNKQESLRKEEEPQLKPNQIKDEEVSIDDDDDDLMFDEEEFESSDSFGSPNQPLSDLKIAEVPANLTGNHWEAYYCEGIMIIALLGYLINFLIGRTKNSQLATTIFRSQRDLLEKNFSLVGDNGQTKTGQAEEQTDLMLKESENLYILWCSGRPLVDSMLLELRFVKRQCLFNSLAAIVKSINDTIVYTVDYSKEDMDTFVFCLARKRCIARLHRDMIDLSQFCLERKAADKKRLSGSYQMLTELSEASSAIIDTRITDFMEKFPDAIEYIHVSDQYTGTKTQTTDPQSPSTPAPANTGTAAQQQDALNISERAVRRVLIVAFNLVPQNGHSLQVTSEDVCNDYLRFVLYLMDRVSLFRLTSKESRAKANKNRHRIEETFLKSVNQQRQEQAQQRREEQRRAEKEKVMKSDDPELQRKWDEKEHKREMKRRQPKMKQMKIKSM
ncbi:unnamed protein product [Rotaria socialis]|uniref:PAT complex subunit CCDC47 n=1 Tax=Rotaria socialis TaxID=392032 RepID=A0A818G5P9_9BILA|nr:unnamed protein product [Rotaria socialis]CAF4338570.1 unnamed protein product [Rotaria socialis]